jgi:hypothetical protein
MERPPTDDLGSLKPPSSRYPEPHRVVLPDFLWLRSRCRTPTPPRGGLSRPCRPDAGDAAARRMPHTERSEVIALCVPLCYASGMTPINVIGLP